MFIENTEELAQNKLLLLYIIKLSPKRFTKNEITEFVLDKNYMNYFLIQQYLVDLTNDKFIEHIEEDIKDKSNSSNKVYNILEKGINALSFFKDRIPEEIKNQLKSLFEVDEKEKIIESQIVCDYYAKENQQYVVSLKLVENEETLFSVYLDVANHKQAKLICENWKREPDLIYQNVINILTKQNVTLLE